jgi:hypothetical protein
MVGERRFAMNERGSELVEKSEALYYGTLKEKLEIDHLHDYVAIEPISGDYFVGKSMSDASSAARKAHPDRLTHLMHIGHRATVEIGFGE